MGQTLGELVKDEGCFVTPLECRLLKEADGYLRAAIDLLAMVTGSQDDRDGRQEEVAKVYETRIDKCPVAG